MNDGNHLLASGAILTVAGGAPVSVEVAFDADTLALTDEVERLTGIWIEVISDERCEDEAHVPIAIEVLETQPTHLFTDERNGARRVRIAEVFGETMALGRACFDDGDEWSPCLRGGVWFDSWDDKPLPGARVEPLASEAQA